MSDTPPPASRHEPGAGPAARPVPALDPRWDGAAPAPTAPGGWAVADTVASGTAAVTSDTPAAPAGDDRAEPAADRPGPAAMPDDADHTPSPAATPPDTTAGTPSPSTGVDLAGAATADPATWEFPRHDSRDAGTAAGGGTALPGNTTPSTGVAAPADAASVTGTAAPADTTSPAAPTGTAAADGTDSPTATTLPTEVPLPTATTLPTGVPLPTAATFPTEATSPAGTAFAAGVASPTGVYLPSDVYPPADVYRPTGVYPPTDFTSATGVASVPGDPSTPRRDADTGPPIVLPPSVPQRTGAARAARARRRRETARPWLPGAAVGVALLLALGGLLLVTGLNGQAGTTAPDAAVVPDLRQPTLGQPDAGGPDPGGPVVDGTGGGGTGGGGTGTGEAGDVVPPDEVGVPPGDVPDAPTAAPGAPGRPADPTPEATPTDDSAPATPDGQRILTPQDILVEVTGDGPATVTLTRSDDGIRRLVNVALPWRTVITPPRLGVFVRVEAVRRGQGRGALTCRISQDDAQVERTADGRNPRVTCFRGTR